MLSWFERRPIVADVLLAAAVLLVFGVLDAFREGADAVVTDLIFALAICFRRRAPGIGLGIAWLGAITQLLTQPAFIIGNAIVLIVVFATGLDGSRLVQWLGLASSITGGVVAGIKLVLLTGVDLPNNQPVPPDPLARGLYLLAVSGIISAALTLFWALGVAARTRRALIAERLDRLESDRVRLSAELRVAQETERNRITREMHDAIGHSLTVVIAQSDGARYALARDPDAAARALAIINRSARSALDDVNELLTVLRAANDGPATMGIADISELVANMNESGLQVDLSHVGDRRELSKAQGLAVYRVLQETLTNALKHGGRGTRIDVRLRWARDRLEIETTTTEPGSDPGSTGAGVGGTAAGVGGSGSGSGILGMTERVRLLGGSLEARPRNDARGFVVRAWLPYTLSSPPDSQEAGAAPSGGRGERATERTGAQRPRTASILRRPRS